MSGSEPWRFRRDGLAARALTSSFVQKLIGEWAPSSILYIAASEHPLFESASAHATEVASERPRPAQSADNRVGNGKPHGSFDLIVADIPLGMGGTGNRKVDDRFRKFPGNWIWVLDLLASLSPNGLGVFSMEPHLFSTDRGRAFVNLLGDEGCGIFAVVDSPEDVLKPYAIIRPAIVLISRGPKSDLFVAEMTTDALLDQIVRNLLRQTPTSDLRFGRKITTASFHGFNELRARTAIEKLETQYKEFQEVSLSEIATDIQLGKQGTEFQKAENALYFPRIGNSPVISDLESARMKHQNYFQVVLKPERVRAEFLELFFRSALGQLVRSSLETQSWIPRVNKKSLQQVAIPLPSLGEQDAIVFTHERLEELQGAIVDFETELALNPKSATAIQDQIHAVLEGLGTLTDADRIRAAIRQGESKRVEFKQTLSLNEHTKKKDQNLQTAALKTVVAFLNTEGGVLLVGVKDDGKITGLRGEIGVLNKGSDDRFLLHFKDLLSTRIGKQFYPFVDYRLVPVEGDKVLQVECAPSDTPCHLDQKDFYVRGNPASDRLEGPELLEYIKHRFPS
ncbi:putative DNA binding domain-containing protein [Deltaproteobacteria bacterium]|nr:putative DNA binding domain-containing protein [Deltaproteobacteria bacterium]